jgi:hypothetical protein
MINGGQRREQEEFTSTWTRECSPQSILRISLDSVKVFHGPAQPAWSCAVAFIWSGVAVA